MVKGDRVAYVCMTNARNPAETYAAVVTAMNSNGTIGIQTDDGDRFDSVVVVKSGQVRPADGHYAVDMTPPPPAPAAAHAAASKK